MRRALAAALAVMLGAALPARAQPPAPGPAPAPHAHEVVHFPSASGDLTGTAPTALSGLLVRPAGDGPFAAVVLLHGCGGLRDASGRLSGRHEDWAQRLRARGWAVLLVDSFTPRGIRQTCTTDGPTLLPGERARDAYGGLAYLQQQPFVRADRVALLGWSHGGGTVLRAIAAGSPARPREPAHGFKAAVAFYPGCRAVLQERAWAPAIPLLMLVGEKDDWTPARYCVDLAERARRAGAAVDVVAYPGAFHSFDAPGTPVRVRENIRATPSGTATVGTDPAARADVIERVPGYLARHLAP